LTEKLRRKGTHIFRVTKENGGKIFVVSEINSKSSAVHQQFTSSLSEKKQGG